jgi:hypothetical protein
VIAAATIWVLTMYSPNLQGPAPATGGMSFSNRPMYVFSSKQACEQAKLHLELTARTKDGRKDVPVILLCDVWQH